MFVWMPYCKYLYSFFFKISKKIRCHDAQFGNHCHKDLLRSNFRVVLQTYKAIIKRLTNKTTKTWSFWSLATLNLICFWDTIFACCLWCIVYTNGTMNFNVVLKKGFSCFFVIFLLWNRYILNTYTVWFKVNFEKNSKTI